MVTVNSQTTTKFNFVFNQIGWLNQSDGEPSIGQLIFSYVPRLRFNYEINTDGNSQISKLILFYLLNSHVPSTQYAKNQLFL